MRTCAIDLSGIGRHHLNDKSSAGPERTHDLLCYLENSRIYDSGKYSLVLDLGNQIPYLVPSDCLPVAPPFSNTSDPSPVFSESCIRHSVEPKLVFHPIEF
jgi:hypothetical protein